MSIECDFKKDVSMFKNITNIKDLELCEKLQISKSSFYRLLSNETTPNDNLVERMYSYFYDRGIRLNLIKEEIYKSEEDEKTLVLMHESKNGIDGEVSISFGNDKRDFGRGFYLGESVRQAISFVSSYKQPYLYFVKLKNIKSLNIVEFNVSREWMILVAYFRGRIDQYAESPYLKNLLESIKNADVIIAPIADNSMYDIINEFIEGSITDLQCVNSLSANRLVKQYVIKNDDVLKNNLEFIDKSYICKLEKDEYQRNKETEKAVGKSKMILAKRKYAGKGKYIEMILE